MFEWLKSLKYNFTHRKCEECEKDGLRKEMREIVVAYMGMDGPRQSFEGYVHNECIPKCSDPRCKRAGTHKCMRCGVPLCRGHQRSPISGGRGFCGPCISNKWS